MISVITPVYNPEPKLFVECAHSVLGQSYSDIEWIIIDDGSSAIIGDIITEIAINDTRVRVFKTEHMGASSARNRGIEAASGRYITFVDADDKVSNSYLEEALACIEATSSDIVFGHMEIIDSSKDYVSNYVATITDAASYRVLEGDNLWRFFRFVLSDQELCGESYGGLIGSTIAPRLIKEELVNSTRFADDMLIAEDGLFFASIVEHAFRVTIVNSVWYQYEINHHSSTRNFDRDKVRKCLRGLLNYVQIGNIKDWEKTDIGVKIGSCVIAIFSNYRASYVETYRELRRCYSVYKPFFQAIDTSQYSLSFRARMLYSAFAHGLVMALATFLYFRSRRLV